MRLPVIHQHAFNVVQSRLAALALSAAIVASPLTALPAVAEMGRTVGEVGGYGTSPSPPRAHNRRSHRHSTAACVRQPQPC